jgi:hypothetical protein
MRAEPHATRDTFSKLGLRHEAIRARPPRRWFAELIRDRENGSGHTEFGKERRRVSVHPDETVIESDRHEPVDRRRLRIERVNKVREIHELEAPRSDRVKLVSQLAGRDGIEVRASWVVTHVVVGENERATGANCASHEKAACADETPAPRQSP